MASSEKTPGISLNKWLGSDIPQRADFVSDNMAIDSAISALQANQGGGGNGNDPRLDTHLADAAAHLTPLLAAQIENSVPVISTYNGNGATSQIINIGFRPQFGVVFGRGEAVITTNTAGTSHTLRFGIVSLQGDTFGIESVASGFRVFHNVGTTAGQTYHGMNQSGWAYVYVMWR